MQLVIVESPTKSRTISRFLGKNYKVVASFGHVRDLPKRELGVDVEKDFQPKYVIPPKAKKIIAELKKRGLKDVYDDMIQKTKEFKKVFIKFIESFAVPTTSVINVLAFTLLIPVLPELFNFIMSFE